MGALVAAGFAFALALLIQVGLWRWRRPAGHYAGLLGVGLAALGLTAAGLAALRPLSGFGYASFATLYVALVLAYATTYSAVQADSPTMSVLLRLEAAGARGASVEELLAALTDDALVVPRLDDLVTGRLARLERDRYVVGRRGALIARTYVGFRRLLKMERGG